MGAGPEKGYKPYGKWCFKELNFVPQMSFIWSIFGLSFGQFLVILVNSFSINFAQFSGKFEPI